MSKKVLLLLTLLTICISCLIADGIVQADNNSKTDKTAQKKTQIPYHARQAQKKAELDPDANEKLRKLDLAKLRARYFYNQRAFPQGIPADWRIKGLEQLHQMARQISPTLDSSAQAIGPAPISNGRTFGSSQAVAGRVVSLVVDPKDPQKIYLGAAQGGLWRSTDAGQVWKPMIDNAPTQAIGAIALDPNDSNIIYVGTGEGNLSGDSFGGMGVLKSVDGGQNWTMLATKTFVGLSFNSIIIDPSNTQTLYAAVSIGISGGRSRQAGLGPNGIYKSTNGGQSWQIIFPNSAQSVPTVEDSGMDLVMDPRNPATLYASLYLKGIYKTTDSGLSWQQLTNGLPTSGVSRSALGISSSDPNTLYTAFGDSRNGDLLNIYRSSNGGNSWKMVSKPPRSLFGNICQCFYDNFLKVDPTDANTLYYGGVALYKSTNGGQSWIDLTIGFGLHADFHAMAFATKDGQSFYVGNDGGVWSSPDGGSNWSNLNQTLNISQFQSIAIHPTDPIITFGGTQDNGTNKYLGQLDWTQVDDGDGGFVSIDQTNPQFVYHTYFNFSGLQIGLVRSEQGGQLNSWLAASAGINQNDPVLFYAPFILDPNNQNTLYFGTNRLYKTTNQANSWQPISDSLTKGGGGAIAAIAVAEGNPKVIYTGSSDGAVFSSQDGLNFRDVTDNLPPRFVTDIVVDPKAAQTVYVSLSGFQAGHVYKSISGGKNWQDISGNLPDAPAIALAINPSNSLNLFVGTDLGLFQTIDGGRHWQVVTGIPVVSIFDIAINSQLGILRAATHGRGVYELKIATTNDKTPPTITVTAPNGGETLMVNDPFNITWQSQDDVGLLKHDIMLSTDGGVTFPTIIATGLAGQVQSFVGTVANTITNQARIRIVATDTSGNQTADNSDSNFIISSKDADFALDLGDTITIKRGQTMVINVKVIRTAGFADAITIAPDANNLKLLKIKAMPPSVSTTGVMASFSLKLKKKAPLGMQSITFTGSSAGRVRSGTLNLLIQ